MILDLATPYAWESHSEKEMIIGKVIFEISRKYDVHNNYETDYSQYIIIFLCILAFHCRVKKILKF